jgi:cytochrome P450
VPPLYDPLTPNFAERAQQVYATLLSDEPVHQRSEGWFVLSRHEDVRRAAGDAVSFSSRELNPMDRVLPVVNHMDPPEHTYVRRLLTDQLDALSWKRLEEIARKAVRTNIYRDRDGVIDLMPVVTAVPTTTIAHLCGISNAEIGQFTPFMRQTVSLAEAHQAVPAFSKIYLGLSRLISERTASPRRDVISGLIKTADRSRMSRRHLLGAVFNLIVAANETTSALLANIVILLADNPEVRSRLGSRHELGGPVVEEALRLGCPVQVLPRRATRNVLINKVSIPRGSRVDLLFAAANLDPEVFAEPQRFDPLRPAHHHLAFGHGPHHCLGADIARRQARVFLEELMRIQPSYQVVAADRIRSPWANAFSTLKIR